MLLKQIINEMTTPENYQPSEIERIVLSIVLISETPTLALSLIDSDSQRFTSMQKLVRLGLLQMVDGGVALTDNGFVTAQQQALVDDMQQPTDTATELAASIDPQGIQNGNV